jgi:hypothetical protein
MPIFDYDYDYDYDNDHEGKRYRNLSVGLLAAGVDFTLLIHRFARSRL